MATAAETVWDRTKNTIPGVQLGGICANKPGYHNTRDKVLANFGSDYSTFLALDLAGPGNVCAAVDLTMSTTQMRLHSSRLRGACLDPIDDRTGYIREWIGTTTGTVVDCYIHNTQTSAFVYDGNRDSSHLWHIHISFFRKFAADAKAGRAIASILNGQSYGDWLISEGGGHAPIPQQEEASWLI